MTAATPPPQEDGPEDAQAGPDVPPPATIGSAELTGGVPAGTPAPHDNDAPAPHDDATLAPHDNDAPAPHDGGVAPDHGSVTYPDYYVPTRVDVALGAKAPRTGIDRLWVKTVVGVSTAGVITLLGFPLGWLWSTLAPGLPVVINDQRQLLLDDVEGEQRAAAEGTYILLTIGAGIVLAILAWVLLRRFRGIPTAVALAIGGSAMGWLAWRFGHTIGLSHALHLAATAPVGTVFTFPADLRIKQPGAVAWWHGLPYISGVLLYAGIAALLVYLLCVGFSSSPSLLPRKLVTPSREELPPGTEDSPGGIY